MIIINKINKVYYKGLKKKIAKVKQILLDRNKFKNKTFKTFNLVPKVKPNNKTINLIKYYQKYKNLNNKHLIDIYSYMIIIKILKLKNNTLDRKVYNK